MMGESLLLKLEIVNQNSNLEEMGLMQRLIVKNAIINLKGITNNK